jgi:hypothetical protein
MYLGKPAMGWPHEDSWEVRLVLRVLERLRNGTESVNYKTGEVSYGLDFVREWTIPKGWRASYRRFDFAVWTANSSIREPEFFIEVHGKQHYEFSFLGDEVAESDRLKSQWAKANKIPLLVLPHHEVLMLRSDDELTARISKFLGVSNSPRPKRG